MSFRVCHPQRPNALALSTDDVIAVMGDDSVSIVDATEVMCASPSSLRRAEVRVPWGTGSVPAPGGDDESKVSIFTYIAFTFTI